MATLQLLNDALATDEYERLVFLQGSDYPIKPSKDIVSFFETNKNIEFIRACCCSETQKSYFAGKASYVLFMDNYNVCKKVWNKIIRKFDLRMRKPYITDGQIYKIYWGSAQFAITGACAKYILSFSMNHPKFNDWFKFAFPVDEMYFATIVHNSTFSSKTLIGGPEPCKVGLVNWRNLHYFEYGTSIKTWSAEDYEFILNLDELYIRKIDSEHSQELLDMLDTDTR